ncbi:hypothetical protein BY996DRAFT_6523720 [Phakopsora pachyrhizi]|nr:hypothetical protein BY996DRAFT_6523720 [Phakopsora pachyrhizi]
MVRLGWAEAKGAEIDLTIDIDIDSEIREGRAGLGWAESEGSEGVKPYINSDIGKGRAGLGWAESEGAKTDIDSNIASNIGIDSNIGEGRAGLRQLTKPVPRAFACFPTPS